MIDKEEEAAAETQQKIVQTADKGHRQVDFTVKFEIKSVAIELTGNKADLAGNAKLLSFGYVNQGVTIKKRKNFIEANAFGVTFGVYNSFEEVYKFIMRTKNTMQATLEHVQSTLKDDEYVQSLKEAVDL